MAEQKESGIDWRAFTPEDSPKTPMDLRADPARQAFLRQKCAGWPGV